MEKKDLGIPLSIRDKHRLPPCSAGSGMTKSCVQGMRGRDGQCGVPGLGARGLPQGGEEHAQMGCTESSVGCAEKGYYQH